jgi:hypothetical protein
MPGFPKIAEVVDGRVVPTDLWCSVFNRTRLAGQESYAAAQLGLYVASFAIEHTDGSRYLQTIQSFEDATVPPMREMESLAFASGFLKLQILLEQSADLQARMAEPY